MGSKPHISKRTAADGAIRAITCYTINCSDCGEDCWEDWTPHFASESELRRQLLEDGWTDDQHRRWLCRRCTQSADCARDGHQWPEWATSALDSECVWRCCEHCDELEESLAALLPGWGGGA
jgi:hypothetical protein